MGIKNQVYRLTTESKQVVLVLKFNLRTDRLEACFCTS
jgi:hypothetical protein